MIVTLTIFAVVASLSMTVLSNSMRSTKKIQAQAYLYTEAHALMDQITRVVERSAIDYEAYYDRNVYAIIEDGETIEWMKTHRFHTPEYGAYGKAFFNPGTTGGPPDGGPDDSGPYGSIGGYGEYCVDGVGVYPDDCDSPSFETQDTNTFTHPFVGIADFAGAYESLPEDMNAMCRREVGDPVDFCDFPENYVHEELILISSTGDERTVFKRREKDLYPDDYDMKRVDMLGEDTDSDGFVDTWECTPVIYDCGDNFTPNLAEFEVITPSNVSVDAFNLYITPLDDPYRAIFESGSQLQPQVTIFMTMSLSEGFAEGILGELPNISIQRTISTEVYQEIKTFE